MKGGLASMSRSKKVLAAVALVLVVIAFRVWLVNYLTLDFVKESRAQFALYYEGHRALVVAAYMAVYIVVTALSLPGAAVMTLAGGAIFGLALGAVVVSFASTIGATLACAAARFLLRDWVQGLVGERLKAVNRGVEEEGLFYLFTLRLIPLFPFWTINLAMGLTRMPLRTFYWVSQAGMLPGTIVYVNAGRELGKLESLSGILSPTLILSFAFIGVLPLAAKKLVGLWRKRRGRGQSEI